MPAVQLRPRSLPEVVDAAFELLRARYVPLITVGAIILAPVIVLDAVLPTELEVIGKLVANFLYTLFDAAVIVVVSDAYLGRDADVPATLRSVGARAGRLFGASMYRGLLVGIGLLLLLIPGMIAFAWTFAMPMVIMLEDADSASDAFARSRALVRGDVPRVLGVLVLGFIVMMLLTVLGGMALGVLASLFGGGPRAIAALGMVTVILVYPLVSVIGTLLYYDLRIRKEGFDLEMMARELGMEGAGAPAASVV